MSNNKVENKDYVSLPYFGLNKLLPYLKPYRYTILSMVALGLLTSSVDILWPLFQQYALDEFIGKGTLNGLGVFIACYVVCLLGQVLMSFISCYQANEVEMYVGRDLKRLSFNHLQTLSFSYYNQNSVGYIHARVMSDTGRIGGLVSWSLMDGVWNVTYLVGAIIVMLSINVRLALLVLVVVPLTVLASAYFQKKLVFLNRKIREINSSFCDSISSKASASTRSDDRISA